MTQVKFRVAAYTDAAGRYNPEAPRNGNEDNMFVNADLGAPEGSPFFESDKETVLTDYGCLLVVADGMGGMNAGEVASEIAVNVVKGAFSKETIPHSAMEDSAGREKYLKKVVVMADEAVKSHANDHSECEGMGSTLVMAWLYGEEASIAWLGDSRIYLFREPEGLMQVSKDHSYVQELVDQGKITEEEAFTHPYNNVITRSLGDMSKKAVADSLTIKLFKRDILLLNSDGLSGVLHDEEMGQIIRANRETMSACRTELWKAAEVAGWHDNVTAVLCEITEGEEYVVEPAHPTEDPDKKPSDNDEEAGQDPVDSSPVAHKSVFLKSKKVKAIAGAAFIAALVLLSLFFFPKIFGTIGKENPAEEVADSTQVVDTAEVSPSEPVTVQNTEVENPPQKGQQDSSGGQNGNRNQGKKLNGIPSVTPSTKSPSLPEKKKDSVDTTKLTPARQPLEKATETTEIETETRQEGQ